MLSSTDPLLSWCCIGAQKAGTSTLYTLLSKHPSLVIPPAKEEPFFHQPYNESKLDEYMAKTFPIAKEENRNFGTVTPQYMSSRDTAERLYSAFPQAKIIVLLRDPVERAHSHYRMNVRRGLETRSFANAISDQLDVAVGPDAGRLDPDDELGTYVERGRYGRLLAPWFNLYGSQHVSIVFTADLESDPLATLHGIHRFLEVEPYTSGHEGIRRHADPPRHRFPALRRRVTGPLRKVGLLERIPRDVRERLGYRIESALAKVAPAGDGGIPPDVISQLRDVYADDSREIEKLSGQRLPWLA